MLLFWASRLARDVHPVPTLIKRLLQQNTEKQSVETVKEIADEKTRVEGAESDLLWILHLTKSFGSNVAVEDVSFGISEGEIFALLPEWSRQVNHRQFDSW